MNHESWTHCRPVALGVPTRNGGAEHLVSQHEDATAHKDYDRPPGRTFDFKDRSDDAVTRDSREEVNATFVPGRRLSVLENHFERNGECHHEVVFGYPDRLADD